MKRSFFAVLHDFIEREGLEIIEGQRGLSNFEQIVRTLGYKSLNDFLIDNPGAIEALVEWIEQSDNATWHENIENASKD